VRGNTIEAAGQYLDSAFGCIENSMKHHGNIWWGYLVYANYRYNNNVKRQWKRERGQGIWIWKD
jgi:hypothetical protein